MQIKSVVIIGSGTMGSGIAAHLCNANVPVTLLDLSTDISTKARERIFKSRPPLLIDKKKIDNIKVGNIDDDFDVVKEADWIVEAVVERIDIKHKIYDKIFKNRKSGAIVCKLSTSTPFVRMHFFKTSVTAFVISFWFFDSRAMINIFSSLTRKGRYFTFLFDEGNFNS